MSRTKPSLADLIRTLADEDSLRLDAPPSAHTLARYAAGELSEEEAERIRDHLALRDEGRDEVFALNLPLPSEPPSEEFRVSGQEIDEAWRDLAADLGLAEVAISEVGKAAEDAGAGLGSWVVWLKRHLLYPVPMPALAAALAVGIVGASLWHRETPWLNVQVVDLELKDHIERSGPDSEDALQSVGQPQVWNLDLADLKKYSYYEVEILDASGELLWRGRTRQRTKAGNLNVHLPPNYLDPGIYQVDLYGVQGEERKILEEYVARIAP